jgi:hypothetical protein
MSSNNSTKVAEALNILCNVRDDTLQSHKIKTLLVFHKLRTFVEGNVHQTFSDSSLTVDENVLNTSSSFFVDDSQNSLVVHVSQIFLTTFVENHYLSRNHRDSLPQSLNYQEISLSSSISKLIEVLNKEFKNITSVFVRSEDEVIDDELK